MKKFWIMFSHEYTRHVLRKRFIFAVLSVPLWILISLGAGFLSVVLLNNPTPVGYIDHAGILDQIDFHKVASSGLLQVNFQRFANENEANIALEGKKIQAFFVLPADYRETMKSQLYYLEEPNESINNQFADVLREGLLKEESPQVARRILEGTHLTIEATQEERTMASGEWMKIAAPLIAGFFLIVSVFTSAGYLMQAVVEEKENRTMEILATSVSPTLIMSGKIMALISVGLTQILVWMSFPLISIGFARAHLPFLNSVAIDWRIFGIIVVTALPTFILISSLMAAVGATVTEAREGQQVSTLITLPVMVPVMLLSVIMANPHGPIALILTFFPLTAGLTLLIRMAFATVPTWQTIVSSILLVISAVGALWLAGRIFRIGMLRYGKRINLRDLYHALVQSSFGFKKQKSENG